MGLLKMWIRGDLWTGDEVGGGEFNNRGGWICDAGGGVVFWVRGGVASWDGGIVCQFRGGVASSVGGRTCCRVGGGVASWDGGLVCLGKGGVASWVDNIAKGGVVSLWAGLLACLRGGEGSGRVHNWAAVRPLGTPYPVHRQGEERSRILGEKSARFTVPMTTIAFPLWPLPFIPSMHSGSPSAIINKQKDTSKCPFTCDLVCRHQLQFTCTC